MNQNIPLAIVITVIASLFFALGSTVQKNAVGRQIGENRLKLHMGISDLWALVRAPRWLAGLALAGVGSVLNIVGLVLAPVTVVQPIGILAVPWSVILSAKIHRHTIPRMKWLAVAEALVGTLSFTILAATHATTQTVLDPWRIPIACAVVYAAAEGLVRLGARGREKWRCFFWASGGAFFYGLESALVRTLTEFIRRTDWLHSPLFWVIAAALVAGSVRGAWMLQQGYATGPAEVVVGALTVTNPVVAVLFGIVVLGEGANITAWVGFWMTVSAAVAIFGVFSLSHSHTESRPIESQQSADVEPDASSDSGLR
ncbi:MAG: EamA/RhaT family transporter [Coriobacteriia bacterium]|nr:EamA/RhaT family transporter [Coriobacteriia bacterium]